MQKIIWILKLPNEWSCFPSMSVAASKEAMADAGIEVEIRQVPNDKKINAVNAL